MAAWTGTQVSVFRRHGRYSSKLYSTWEVELKTWVHEKLLPQQSSIHMLRGMREWAQDGWPVRTVTGASSVMTTATRRLPRTSLYSSYI